MDDLLSNSTDEEIKIILSQQDNAEETVGNTLAQKYVEEIKLHFDQQIAGMTFYMENILNELKKNFTREYVNMTSTKDTLDILEFYRNDNNQLREQVKELHEILNGIVKVLQFTSEQTKPFKYDSAKSLCQHQISPLLERKIPVGSLMT